MIKNLPANAGDARDSGLMPGSGRYPEAEICNPLQYPCPENPMDRETSQAAVHGIARSPTRLSMHTFIHTASHPGPVSVSEPCCVFLVSHHIISLPLSCRADCFPNPPPDQTGHRGRHPRCPVCFSCPWGWWWMSYTQIGGWDFRLICFMGSI